MPIKVMQCPYCGTKWKYSTRGDRSVPFGGVSGFIEATVMRHIEDCRFWTPEERLAFIERNRKRLARKPNKHTTVTFNETFVREQMSRPTPAAPDADAPVS